MVINKFFEYISHDKRCLLGLTTTSNGTKLISPLNVNFIYPKENLYLGDIINPSGDIINPSGDIINPSGDIITPSGNWLIDKNILYPNNVDLNNKYFENLNIDWNILTLLNLSSVNSDNEDFKLNNYSFSTKIFIDTNNINNKTIQIFKQGEDSLNGVFDTHFEFRRENNISGDLDEFIVNVYYITLGGSSNINKQTLRIKAIDNKELFNKFLDKWIQLTITIDSINGIIKVYVNNELINTTSMNLQEMMELPLNIPINNLEKNLNFIIGGSTNLKMKNAFVFNRCINPMELKFLNKLNNN